MKKRYILGLIGVVLFILLIVLSLCLVCNEEFEVDIFLLKSVVKQGEEISQDITIESFTDTSYSVDVVGFDFFALSESEFSLSKGEERVVELSFNAVDVEAGVYVGYLSVSTGVTSEMVPIVIEVQTQNVYFVPNLDVSHNYKEVVPGNDFVSSVRIVNVKDTKDHTLDVTYQIQNLDSEVLFTESESIVVGTDISITKSFNLPSDVNLGDYVFIVLVENEESFGTASDFFSVVDKKVSYSENNMVYTGIISVAILLFLVVILILFLRTVGERNRLLAELSRQHSLEYKFSLKDLEKEEKVALKKARGSKKVKKDYELMIKKELQKLKRRQFKQTKALKGLKSVKEMEKKLDFWQSKTQKEVRSELEKELKPKFRKNKLF